MNHAFLDLASLQRQGEPAVLATVVRGRGSTYRKPGASAVITGAGTVLGAISGGCLEQDVLEVAREILQTGAARLLTYDTGSEEDLLWGTGSGCGGQVDVLVAGVDPGLLGFIHDRLQAVETVAVVTVIGGPNFGHRVAVARDGSCVGDLGDPAATAQARELGLRRLGEGDRRPEWAAGPGGMELFVQPVTPPPVLAVIGAGDDARPVVELARRMGFRVAVIDHRIDWVTPERFPQADHCILEDDADLPALFAGGEAFAVLMTHRFDKDLAWLAQLLASPVRYVGLLGARERTRMLLDSLYAESPDLKASVAEKLRAPVGLDIGADGPEEIALSIMAELLAFRTGRVATQR